MSEPHAEPEPTRPTGAPRDGASATAWRLAASSATGVGLGLALGLHLALAAFIPDRLPPRELARALGFGRAEIALGLGLEAPLRSWLVWLLALLVALHLVARVLARRGGPRFEVAGTRRSRLPEALTLVGLGVTGLLAGAALHQDGVFDGRVTVRAGGASVSRGEVEVAPGLVVPRALPFALRCALPDPLDPTFAVACALAEAGADEVALTLAPGAPSAAGRWVVSLEAAVWGSPSGEPPEPATVLWRTGTGPLRLSLRPGATHAVKADGREAVFEAGGAGAWLATAGEDGTASLLWPTVGAATAFEAVMPLDLTLRVVARPGGWLAALAFAFIAAGLLVGAFAEGPPAERAANRGEAG